MAASQELYFFFCVLFESLYSPGASYDNSQWESNSTGVIGILSRDLAPSVFEYKIHSTNSGDVKVMYSCLNSPSDIFNPTALWFYLSRHIFYMITWFDFPSIYSGENSRNPVLHYLQQHVKDLLEKIKLCAVWWTVNKNLEK